jgi:hypothetical protein
LRDSVAEPVVAEPVIAELPVNLIKSSFCVLIASANKSLKSPKSFLI